MKYILEKLDTVPASAIVIVIMIVFFSLGWYLSKRKEITSLWESWYNNKKRKEELLSMLLDSHQKVGEYEEKRKHDREQSFKIQKQLIDANENLAKQLADLTSMMKKNQEQTDERFKNAEEKSNQIVRADMKTKILRAYHVYKEKKQWNEMEREAFYDLVESYTNVGGNHFVHSIIVPESYTWEVVTIEEDE